MSTPSTAVNAVAYRTIVRRELSRIGRIWTQALVPPVITMTLYLLIFGNLIGRRVGEMGGHAYVDFIAPGVIMLAIINNSYSNVSSSFFSARLQHYVEEMLVSPTAHATILLGYVTGGMARGCVVGLSVTLVTMLFADLEVTSVLVTIAVVVLTSVLFSLAGFLNAVFAKHFEDISIIPTFVLTPLTYLGGVFYSIELLPEPWRGLSLLNPILYMVNAFRYGMLGVSDIDIWTAFAVLVITSAGLFVLCLRTLNRGVGVRT